jgi:hypothetical protein
MIHRRQDARRRDSVAGADPIPVGQLDTLPKYFPLTALTDPAPWMQARVPNPLRVECRTADRAEHAGCAEESAQDP